MRPDYVSQLTDRRNWVSISDRTKVLKFFIEALTPAPSHLSDDDLRKLVELCAEFGFTAAFEVGGLRMSPGNMGQGSGARYAETECKVLQRWIACGGSVGYITTDNAVMTTIALLYQHQPPPLGRGYRPSIDAIIQEAAEATGLIATRFPQARIGATEALGYFDVFSPNRGVLRNLAPTLIPRIALEEFLDKWLAALLHQGVSLNHFHIDFGYEAVLADGRGKTLSFDRIASANMRIQDRGIATGLMVGAFDYYSLAKTPPPDAAAANQSAITNTMTYLREFMRANITVDQLLFDRWEPYPDHTGPASDPLSDMGLTQNLLSIIYH